ncbi:T9SS type A sorting domain-containing protein [Flavobacterium sp. Sd200]|uniref:T9SS type A sorting domain-containing protein n=1 Tax=Flavobacterium sp. Sd200 TaxID=2692211 RepID=UPI00136F5A8C|nr:T9SS type A sorting domain-containing protein [Flavobacterium sp. Sd200]MXN92521.1 T9SS type A sorting domain-containing protein [Flavobacterium sp. Sd200]
MRTKLLSLALAVGLFTTALSAQTKIWDFGNDRDTWPLGSGVSGTVVVDNLGLFASAPDAENQISNFGAITASNATFPDEFSGTHRFQLNGAGYTGSTFLSTPTQRFLYLNVSGACTIKVWFKTGSNGSTRTVYVTDGTNTIGSASTNDGTNNDFAIITANYTGTGGRLYVYGSAACNLYKMEVRGATVSTPVMNTNGFEKGLSANVFSNGRQVYVSNVASSTQVDVYSMTGALVKTLQTSTDTDFDFLTSGLYIVNLTSAEGRKSFKVAVQ